MHIRFMKYIRSLLIPVVFCLLWVTPSCAQNYTIESDVVYGETGGQPLMLDIYMPKPEPTSARPAIVIVHGGGWSAGSRKGALQQSIAKTFAQEGFVCVSVGYRLVTRDANKYPAAVDDVQRAVRWLRANARKYHIDPNRIGAIGDSAGGHLVSLLGTRETRDNSDPALARYSSKVNCVVNLYGPADFTIKASPAVNSAAISILTYFFGKTQEEAPEIYREASPVTHVSKNSAPFLIFHGSQDFLVPLDQSQRLHDALKRAGAEVKLVVVDDGHGFRKKENQELFFQETRAFFARHLKP
jgi:acetyl esterase/lipase